MNKQTALWTLVLAVAALWLAYRFASTGAGSAYAQEVDGRWAQAAPTDYVAGTARFSVTRTIGLWTAAFFTLAAFSFMYRDNPLYKFTEATIVGSSAAYWMVVAFWSVLLPNLVGKLWPAWVQSWAMPGLSPIREDYWWTYVIPLALGGMLLWRLAPRGAWIARWPLAFIIGTMAGIRLLGFLEADFLSQIRNGLSSLLVFSGGEFLPWDSLRVVLVLLGVLACLVYFFFSFEHKGVIGGISRVGVWVLMITFGAMFGYTVMGRIALLAIRLEFLFDDWLWLIDPLNHRLGL
jgi:hypothetical protein